MTLLYCRSTELAIKRIFEFQEDDGLCPSPSFCLPLIHPSTHPPIYPSIYPSMYTPILYNMGYMEIQWYTR